MKSRALAVLLIASAALSWPSRLPADKPRDQTYPGVFAAVSNCAEAQYELVTFCTRHPFLYVVFKGKGAKRLDGRRVFVQGPLVPTSCGLPAVEMKKVAIDDSPPPDCPG